MRSLRQWMQRCYGAGPLHLLSLVACGALTAYVVTRLDASGSPKRIFIWFGAAIIAHDLVLWPLYAIADRTATWANRRRPRRLPAVPWINHLRVPVVLSGTLLAVSFPLVLRLSARVYRNNSGLSESPFLGRWLLITGVLFAASAVLYAIRLRRAGAADRSASTDAPAATDPSAQDS